MKCDKVKCNQYLVKSFKDRFQNIKNIKDGSIIEMTLNNELYTVTVSKNEDNEFIINGLGTSGYLCNALEYTTILNFKLS